MLPIFPQVAACAPDLRSVLTARRHTVTVLMLIATVTFAVCMATGLGGYASGVSTIGTALMATVAGAACLVRAGRCTGRMRWAWGSIGLGMLCYAFGDARWTWVETVRGEAVPFPSLADAGYLAMPSLVVAGLLMVPVAQQSIANRIRSVVDGLMIATSLLLVSWLLVIDPLLAQGSDSPVALPVVLAYPVSDIVLVTVVCYMLALLRRDGRNAGQLMLIAAAAGLIGLSDTVYAYGTLGQTYVSGNLLDTGWFAGFALIALAARRPDSADPDHREGTDERQQLAIVLPYAVVVAALLISVARHGEADAFANWCRSVLILLIVARQLLTLLENRRLTRNLESRVAARTADLYASEQRFQALVQQSSDSVTVIDADSTVRYQSESVERIFGWPAALLLGHRLTRVAGRRAGPRIAAAIESVIGEPYATTVVELQLRHRDGRLRQAEMTMTNLLDDPSVGGLVLNTRDIHDAKELQDQLVHEAYHDGLTGLASRALFREQLQGALEVSRRDDDVAILFLDLDGFKEVNDSLGHAAGDQLLVQVADRLRESVRDGDTVARFGGDEFAVLVESVAALADAETVARRIIDAVGRPFPISGRELHVGASVGIASAADAGDIEQLMRNADLAMYRAKAGGGSGLAAYDPQMHDQLMDRLELEADLRVALDRGELALHYQPTVALRTGEIVGFEALVRWYHPTRGIVSPLDFIGIAEATGLIVPLGRWVLTEACRQAVRWGAGAGRALKMAVNVSVRQFDHGDLAGTVAEVLAQTQMPADQLCLEMTESVLLSDTDENLAQLLRVKALGVALAMDDFGTGYSSLAYLRRFPLDVLKIDRSFVDRLGGDSEDVALVHTIVRLGKSLGMATVAEGIEDPEQLAALREMDCDYAQGYFLSRPLPAGEAGGALESGLPGRVTVTA
jgi:diguanylate cyclase (GGDEF)-like protein/PAS domain S-box-containing protein